MQIALLTIGSTGDAQPFLALAAALRRGGHRVRVGTHELYRERFEAVGVEFAATGAPVDLERMERFRVRITESRNQLAAHAMVVDELILDGADALFHDSRELLRGCDAAICHSMNLVGQAAIAAGGTRWASVLLCPGTLQSGELPPMHLPSLGRWGNRLLWEATRRITRAGDRRLRARLCELSGLDGDVSLLGGHAPELNLVAASPAIAPIPSDLPTGFSVTGHWHHQEGDAVLSDRVEDFLAAGPAPVTVALGSAAFDKRGETVKILLDALARNGHRAIIQTGFDGRLRQDSPPDGVLFADALPHHLLFPRTACVVHHAGAGTSHAACRAGVPSIAIPHFADQFYWAKRLRERGVAARPLARTRLSGRRLAARLEEVLSSEPMRRRAAQLGQRLREERGVERALELIERWAARPAPGNPSPEPEEEHPCPTPPC